MPRFQAALFWYTKEFAWSTKLNGKAPDFERTGTFNTIFRFCRLIVSISWASYVENDGVPGVTCPKAAPMRQGSSTKARFFAERKNIPERRTIGFLLTK